MARRGRPPRIDGEPATERIWARLTLTERAALKAQADREGVTVAVLVREAVNVYVADAGDVPVFLCTCNSAKA